MAERGISKELFDERFNNLTTLMHTHFNNLNDKLERIEAQVTKTNGRVTSLEQKNLTHFQECPNTKKIEDVENDLSEYKMFKKYPKLAIAVLFISLLFYMSVTIETLTKLNKFINEGPKIEKVENMNK